MPAEEIVEAEKVEETTARADIRKTGIHPDFWYPLARSGAVKKGKAHAVTFAGQEIVLVRGENGVVFAMEDRCAHRQVPLHLGVVEKDGIRCGYHGWKYNHTGKCVNVPYLEKCSLRPKDVRGYPCREAFGLVFVYPGNMENFDAAVFPQIPSASDSKYKTRYLDRKIDCHFSFMHENLMDMNHQFLHRRFMGGIKTTLLEKEQGENWIEAVYTFDRTSGKQPLGEKLILKSGNPASQERDRMTIRTDYPYQTLQFRTGGSEHPALDLWNVYVPRDREQRTNHTYGLMMIRRPSIPLVLELAWPFIIWFTNHIFTEDRRICELEQLAYDHQGEDRNHEIFPVIRSLRQVLTRSGVPLVT